MANKTFANCVSSCFTYEFEYVYIHHILLLVITTSGRKVSTGLVIDIHFIVIVISIVTYYYLKYY